MSGDATGGMGGRDFRVKTQRGVTQGRSVIGQFTTLKHDTIQCFGHTGEWSQGRVSLYVSIKSLIQGTTVG